MTARAFRVVMKADEDTEEDEDEEDDGKWNTKEGIMEVLTANGFCNVGVHDAIHSKAFENVERFWKFVEESCPYVDTGKVSEEKMMKLGEVLREVFGVGKGKALFMMSAAMIAAGEKV